MLWKNNLLHSHRHLRQNNYGISRKKALTPTCESDKIPSVAGIPPRCLGVAQFGSVLEWGSRGRRFESSHPDLAEP